MNGFESRECIWMGTGFSSSSSTRASFLKRIRFGRYHGIVVYATNHNAKKKKYIE